MPQKGRFDHTSGRVITLLDNSFRRDVTFAARIRVEHTVIWTFDSFFWRLPMHLRGAFKTLVATAFVTIFLWATQPSSGQAVNGTLLGTITDATGAAVGGARIIATQT